VRTLTHTHDDIYGYRKKPEQQRNYYRRMPVCCIVLQCIALSNSTTIINVCQFVAVYSNVLQCCSVLQTWATARLLPTYARMPNDRNSKGRANCRSLCYSCHTYEWVMSQAWMCHVSGMNESSLYRLRQLPSSLYSCHTYEWVISHVRMCSHPTGRGNCGSLCH